MTESVGTVQRRFRPRTVLEHARLAHCVNESAFPPRPGHCPQGQSRTRPTKPPGQASAYASRATSCGLRRIVPQGRTARPRQAVAVWHVHAKRTACLEGLAPGGGRSPPVLASWPRAPRRHAVLKRHVRAAAVLLCPCGNVGLSPGAPVGRRPCLDPGQGPVQPVQEPVRGGERAALRAAARQPPGDRFRGGAGHC